MKCSWIVLGVGLLLLASTEAKKKRKFEGDFEFADEVGGRLASFVDISDPGLA